MPGTKIFNHWLRLRGSKQLLVFVIFFPALAATTVFGQESMMALGMVGYNQSTTRLLANQYDLTADPIGYSYTVLLQYRMAGLKSDHQNTTNFTLNFLPQSQIDTLPRDWFQQIYKKSETDGRTGIWAHVEAGYGQFCQFESCLGKDTVEVQQPSCAYLRASFSF
jgi:hypothetical protein